MQINLSRILKTAIAHTYVNNLHIHDCNDHKGMTITKKIPSIINKDLYVHVTVHENPYDPTSFCIFACLNNSSISPNLYTKIINKLLKLVYKPDTRTQLSELKDFNKIKINERIGSIYKAISKELTLITIIDRLAIATQIFGINNSPQDPQDISYNMDESKNHDISSHTIGRAPMRIRKSANISRQAPDLNENEGSVVDWNTFIKSDLAQEKKLSTSKTGINFLSDANVPVRDSQQSSCNNSSSLNTKGSYLSVMPHEINIHKSILNMNLSHEASSADLAEAHRMSKSTNLNKKSDGIKDMTDITNVIKSHMSNSYDDRPKITRHGHRVVRIPHQYYKLYNSNSRAMHYILGYIKGRDYITTSNVAKHLKLNSATVSKGLKILAKHGFISQHRRGSNDNAPRRAYYGNIKYEQPNPHTIWHRSKKGNE